MVCHGDNKSIQMQKHIHEACGKPPSMCDGTWGSLYTDENTGHHQELLLISAQTHCPAGYGGLNTALYSPEGHQTVYIWCLERSRTSWTWSSWTVLESVTFSRYANMPTLVWQGGQFQHHTIALLVMEGSMQPHTVWRDIKQFTYGV